jgi:hypothetical protein
MQGDTFDGVSRYMGYWRDFQTALKPHSFNTLDGVRLAT